MSSSVVSQPAPVPASVSAHVPLPGIRFNLFLREFSRLYQLRDDRDRSLDKTGISGLASALWDTYTPEEKEQWRDCAKDASERHAVLFPNYKYDPKRDGEEQVQARKPWARGPPKWKGGQKEDLGKETAGPWRFVPSPEELGGVGAPVVPPSEVSPIAFDLIRPHMLSSPMMLPPHRLREFTPAQAAIFAGWSWESAQASTIVRTPEQLIGPYDMTEGFPLPASSSLHPSALPLSDIVPGMDVLDKFLKNHPEDQEFSASPSQDDYSNIAPGMDVLDPFLKDHPEDQGDSDMNPPKPIVSHFANLGTFRFA